LPFIRQPFKTKAEVAGERRTLCGRNINGEIAIAAQSEQVIDVKDKELWPSG
jgi:hypothetical protein